MNYFGYKNLRPLYEMLFLPSASVLSVSQKLGLVLLKVLLTIFIVRLLRIAKIY